MFDFIHVDFVVLDPPYIFGDGHSQSTQLPFVIAPKIYSKIIKY